MKLKRNFTSHFGYDEMTYSATAARNGIDNTPKDFDIMLNLSQLCFYLEWLRSILKTPIIINSGYRTLQTNTLVNGHKNSYHMQGLAADIRTQANVVTPLQIGRIITENPHPYYKVEYQVYPTFIHVEIVGRKL